MNVGGVTRRLFFVPALYLVRPQEITYKLEQPLLVCCLIPAFGLALPAPLVCGALRR